VSHKRQTIRNAVATVLANLTTSGARVYKGHVYPSGASCLPGLNITTPKDHRSDDYSGNRKMQVRMLTVAVELRAKPPVGTTVQDQLDTMCSEVETAIMADTTLGGLVHWIEPLDEDAGLTGTLERPAGLLTMTFEAQYTADWT
jgi:hypothetical protein